MGDSLATRARLRLREEMVRRHLSQRDLSDLLGGASAGWSASKVAKLLTDRVEMHVNDLEALCFAIGLSPVEAIRDHGLEFLAEMTPAELRLLERVRQLRPDTRDALLQILDLHTQTRREGRRAMPREKRVQARSKVGGL